MRVYVRYELKDEGDEKQGRAPTTRRDRNEAFGVITPRLTVPPVGVYMWDWYFELSQALIRVRDGVCVPIPPTEFVAWRTASGEYVDAWEYNILREMDIAYCDEMTKELADYAARQRDRQGDTDRVRTG